MDAQCDKLATVCRSRLTLDSTCVQRDTRETDTASRGSICNSLRDHSYNLSASLPTGNVEDGQRPTRENLGVITSSFRDAVAIVLQRQQQGRIAMFTDERAAGA